MDSERRPALQGASQNRRFSPPRLTCRGKSRCGGLETNPSPFPLPSLTARVASAANEPSRPGKLQSEWVKGTFYLVHPLP